jgi:hypothetical protein
LQEKGFIGEPWSYQNIDFYLAGNKFSGLLMFCDCAPCIEFKPLENGKLSSNFVAIRFVSLTAKYFYADESSNLI